MMACWIDRSMPPRSLTDEGRAVPGALLKWRSAFKQNANLMFTLSLPVLRKIGAGEIKSGRSFGLMVIKYLVMEFDVAGHHTRQNQIPLWTARLQKFALKEPTSWIALKWPSEFSCAGL